MGNSSSRSDPSGYSERPDDEQTEDDGTRQSDVRVDPPSSEAKTADSPADSEATGDSSVTEDDGTESGATEENNDTVSSGGSGAGSAIETKRPDTDKSSNRGEDGEGEAGEEDKTSTNDLDVKIVVRTDPWDAVGWGNEPGLRFLEERFGDRLAVFYAVPKSRVIEEWEDDERMPVASDVAVPDTTSASSRALLAAHGQGRFRQYFRRLRIAALSEGRNVESDSVLIELAEEVGLNSDQLREDMTGVDLDDPESRVVPLTEATIYGAPHLWTGRVEGERLQARIKGAGVEEDPHDSSIEEFVANHGLVATAEVAEALDLTKSQVIDRLQRSERIVSRTLGVGTFWST